MNDLLGILREEGAWAIALAVGLALGLIVATELGFALARRRHPATIWMRRTRIWVLPAVAAVTYLRAVLGLPGDNAWVRLAETATWVALVIVASPAHPRPLSTTGPSAETVKTKLNRPGVHTIRPGRSS